MAERILSKSQARALLTLGLPLVGSHLAQLAIGIIDSIMLGRYAYSALAAITLAHSLHFTLFLVGSGFAFAVLPMVARAAASEDAVQVRRVTRMGMWISILYGAAVIPLLLWSEPIFLAMGQTPDLAADAATYLRILSIGMIPSLLVMVLKNYLAALEHTQVVLWTTVAAAVLNAGGNHVLIFGNFGAPELGLQGAAIASVTMQCANLAMLVAFARWRLPQHALFQRLWRPDLGAFGRVFRLGWPIGLTNLAESGLFSASAILVGWLGKLPLAAHGAALQLAAVGFVMHLGLSQAATVRVGQALAAKDTAAMRTCAGTALAISIALSLFVSALFLALPEPFLSIFLDPDEPNRGAILAIGASLLAVAALFQMMDGAQVIALGLLRGIEDTRGPMIIAAFSYWAVGIPVSLVLGFGVGWAGVGVWLGLVAGLGMAAALLLWRFWHRIGALG